MKQTCTITDWHPQTNPNGPQSNRYVRQKRHDIDAQTAWATAKQAGWTFVPGKVRLTIVLVYKKRPLPDQDNLVARVKGVVDGLCYAAKWVGFFTDDSPARLELVVRAETRPGIKATEMVLESIDD